MHTKQHDGQFEGQSKGKDAGEKKRQARHSRDKKRYNTGIMIKMGQVCSSKKEKIVLPFTVRVSWHYFREHGVTMGFLGPLFTREKDAESYQEGYGVLAQKEG